MNFTEAENKIRSKWLFWSIILPAVAFGFIFIVCFFGSSTVSELKAVISFSIFGAGVLYMKYHCAYKNPGTILLSLMMIWCLFGCHFPALYYSYKLRKINKNMQKRILLTSPVYAYAASVFSTTNNLEELNEQFTKLRIADDRGSTVQVLAIAYDAQKKMLSA